MSPSDNGAVLADIENSMATASIKDEATSQRAREHGWVEPQKFDYETYNAGSREEREAVEQVRDVPAWASNAVKYEWSDEYGDVGPEHPELERELFKDQYKMQSGIEFDKLTEIAVTIESDAKIKPVSKFENAGLHPVMSKNIELCGYKVPTPIQAYCLPSILKNRDVIAVAQTGSGKTAAFLIPTLSKLMGKAKKLAAKRPFVTKDWDPVRDETRAEPLVLVVAPTRELATQIFDEARRLCYRSMLRPCVAYGGAPVRDQMDELRKGCDILIATPGRLIDFMERGHLLSLSRVKYTIIDEADEMVQPDWLDEMRKIMGGGDNNEDADHLFMMFSATFPKGARILAREYMSKDHIRVRVGRAGSTHVNVTQKVIFVDEAKKRECLFDLLLSMPPSRVIVFVNGKKGADYLDDFLYNKGLPSTSIHSDRTQREREDALRAFKLGKAPVLVATGVSARGLDVKNVMHVINYDLPSGTYGGIQEYVHRIGRTARIGNVGLATSFYNERNEDIADDLVRLLLETKQEIPEFLESYKPEDTENLQFNDDTDDEDGTTAEAGGEGWGAAVTSAPATDDAWGAPAVAPAAEAEADEGWGSSSKSAPAVAAW